MKIAHDIHRAFQSRMWQLGHGRSLELGPKSLIMGILNITPDSFSDGGVHDSVDKAISAAASMLNEHVDILDVGGESTRPGAGEVSANEEQARVLPIVEALRARFDVPISIDTYRAETARLALSAGAHIVNDVWGLQREPDIAKVAAEFGAGVCIMHTGRDRDTNKDVIKDQFEWFDKSLDIAKSAGITDQQIVLDPGFGFAKDVDENIQLMSKLSQLHALHFPLLIGTSRKRFVGAITGQEEAADRDVGTASTSVLLRMQGASIFRVHNTRVNYDALTIADKLIRQMMGG